MQRKIAVIGANLPLLSFYQQTKQLGFEIHAFAWDFEAVCKPYADFFYPISFTEKELIASICEENKIQGITSFSLESALPTVNFVARKLNLVGNSVLCDELTQDKFSVSNQLKKHNIPIPEFELFTNINDLNNLTLDYPVVVKPVDSGGSRGVTLVLEECELFSAFQQAIKHSKKQQVIIETYVPGKEYSVEYISYKGNHYFITITEKITTSPPYFVELEHHQPANLAASVISKIQRIAEDSLNALHIHSSASHIELKINDNGDILIIEIGARMGGDMITSKLIKLSTGYDFVLGTLNVATNEFTPPIKLYSMCSGIYYLSKESERIKYYMDNSTNYPQIIKKEQFKINLIQSKESNDRAGYLIYQSDVKFVI